MRRKFIDALPSDKSLHSTSVATAGLERCNKIFASESKLSDCTSEERKEKRLAEVKPLLDELFAWLEKLPVTGKGKLTKAVNYGLNEKEYLQNFLDNPDVPIDNNRVKMQFVL